MPHPIEDPTDAKLRDAIQLLQDRKPLPDNYRFLLFEDKRQVELIWNGKTNNVTHTVLPFQTIEVIDEPRPEGSVDVPSASTKPPSTWISTPGAASSPAGPTNSSGAITN